MKGKSPDYRQQSFLYQGLKQTNNLGDETVIAQWVQNLYWQYFSGEKTFQWKFPVEPSDMVHFRKRIGEEGIKRYLKYRYPSMEKQQWKKKWW